MPRHIKSEGEFEDLGAGVTNTGDAAVGDVASGKTFSSAVLTNVAGSSTKNATVPGDAPILPAQAYIDVCQSLILPNVGASISDFYAPNKGITALNVQALFLDGIYSAGGTWPDFHLQGNALDVTTVNALLSAISSNTPGSFVSGILDISGGTNAAPTGQGLTDKAALISAGWTVTTN